MLLLNNEMDETRCKGNGQMVNSANEKVNLRGDVTRNFIENPPNSEEDFANFPFKYLSEEKMTLMQQMARRKLRKEREMDEWMQFVHRNQLEKERQTKTNQGKINEQPSETINTKINITERKAKLNSTPNLRRIQHTIDNQTKMLAGLIGQVQNLSKTTHQNPKNFVQRAITPTPKVNNITKMKPMNPSRSKLAFKRPATQHIYKNMKNNKSTIRKDKVPGFMGMTVSQQQKAKVTQASKANFPRPIQKGFKRNVLNVPTLLKAQQCGFSENDYFKTGEMLKRVTEMEMEAQEIRNRWLANQDSSGAVKIANSGLEVGKTDMEAATVREKVHNRQRLAPISTQTMESIITNLEQFSRYASSSNSALARFASTKPLEIVADSIVDDIVSSVAEELNKITNDVIDELVEAEFMIQTSHKL